VFRIAVCWLTEGDVLNPREPVINVGLSPFWSSPERGNISAWLPCLPDYYSTIAVKGAPTLMGELGDLLHEAAPDVILLEHPWTWPLICDLPEVRGGDIRVIYSSHNVETLLKRRIVQDADIEVPSVILDGVEALERELVTRAWGTVACTKADAATFRSWGGRRVVVANNGAQLKHRDHLAYVLPAPLGAEQRFALFVATQYQPNVSGFFKYVAPALPGLKPNTRLVVVGTVCDSINAHVATSPLRHFVDRRLVSLGFVDEMTLDTLIANASALLLPIEYGGGSHLKTAEALVSGRPIIGTSTSFRGFQKYQSLPRVTIEDSPDTFGTAIHEALARPLTWPDFEVPVEVRWETTLAPAIQLFSSMLNKN
jgi:glycosyltransferase involved in cell wall biosynthesis